MHPQQSPHAQLAGVYWLPRFLNKIRLHRSGQLDEAYQKPFGHPKAIDGLFLRHFELNKEQLVALVESGKSDDEIAGWFEQRTQAEQRASWNEIAINLGKPAYPMFETFQWARQHFHSDCGDASIDTAFKMLDWDEGRG